jgi:hypothetical protein
LFFFLLAVLPDFDDDEGPAVLRGSPVTEAPASATQSDAAAPTAESAAARPSETEPEQAPVRFGIETTDEGEGGFSCTGLGGMQSWSPEVRARVERSCERIAADNGSSFGRALLENVPPMMFFFIPIVAAGMKVLYPLARRKYVEHLLFFVHFHALFFVLATLGLFVSLIAGFLPELRVAERVLGVVGWTYLPIYLFIAMRHVYAQGWVATAFKYTLLFGGYFFALLFTFVGIVFYTALTL